MTTGDDGALRPRWKGKPASEMSPAERRRNTILGVVLLLALCGACALFGRFLAREGGQFRAEQTATAAAITPSATPTATPTRATPGYQGAAYRGTATARAKARQVTEQACRGRTSGGPKNCATATLLARYAAADATASAGGCREGVGPAVGRSRCRATVAAVLTGTPPAP